MDHYRKQLERMNPSQIQEEIKKLIQQRTALNDTIPDDEFHIVRIENELETVGQKLSLARALLR